MKKVTILFAIILLALSAVSCGGNNFIDDGNGHKQYKDSSGNFVKNDWAEIKGKKYFFDMNGYLVTNQWVQDEYYVDDKGAMQTNYWYDDKNGKMYYLGKDGKYVKDTIITIDNNFSITINIYIKKLTNNFISKIIYSNIIGSR